MNLKGGASITQVSNSIRKVVTGSLGLTVRSTSQTPFSHLRRTAGVHYSTHQYLDPGTKKVLNEAGNELTQILKSRGKSDFAAYGVNPYEFDDAVGVNRRDIESVEQQLWKAHHTAMQNPASKRDAFVLRDAAWFTNQLLVFLDQYKDTSGDCPLLEAMSPHYSAHLLLKIGQRFQKLDDEMQARMVGVMEPGLMQKLLARTSVAIPPGVLAKAEILGAQCKRPLTADQVAALYDARVGCSFLSSNCAARLAHHGGESSFQDLISFFQKHYLSGEEALMESYFALVGDVYKGVMFGDKDSSYILGSMDDALRFQSKHFTYSFKQVHSQFGACKGNLNYAEEDPRYDNLVIFRGVKYIDTSGFNPTDAEGTVLPISLQVKEKTVRTFPNGRTINVYTLTGASNDALQGKPTVKIDLAEK